MKKRHIEELDKAILAAEGKGFASAGAGDAPAEATFRFKYDDSGQIDMENRIKALSADLASSRARVTSLEEDLAKRTEEVAKWKAWRGATATLPGAWGEQPMASTPADSTGAIRKSAATTNAHKPKTGTRDAEERLRAISECKMDEDDRTTTDPRSFLGSAFANVAREEGAAASHGHGRAFADVAREERASPSHGAERSSGRPERRMEHSGQRTKVNTLAQAGKVLRIKIENSEEITSFLDKCQKLKNNIEDLYNEEPDQLKIMIALNQMANTVRTDGDGVYEKYKISGTYDFLQFFKDLFKACHPAPQSSLDLNFRNLSQNIPVKGTIVDYARRFKVMVNLLDYNLKAHMYKFIAGLASSELKAALRRQNIENMEFSELVSLAVSISNNLTQEKTADKLFPGVEGRSNRIWGGEEGKTGSSDEEVMLIMGVPLKEYLEKTNLHKLVNKCFNCFGNHRVQKCFSKKCKFCDKTTEAAQHYSLICPKAPKEFKNYLGAREKAQGEFKRRDGEKVKFTSEYKEYEFDSEELSD